MSHLHVQWSLSLKKHTKEESELFVLTIELEKEKQ
jgi:hypothetical protein